MQDLFPQKEGEIHISMYLNLGCAENKVVEV